MKRSTASWTTAIAASALLALPAGSWAQQATPSTTPREQTPGAAAPQTGRTPGADMPQGSANEHLRQAQSALADIPEAALTGTTKTRVAELKRHLNKLEQAASQKQGSGSSAPRAASANWSGDVAAADRILTELLGTASTTGASTPAPAGTSGTTAAAPKTTTSGKSDAATSLDESARTKLQEVRTHITAFAAAMSGGPASTPSSDDPSSPASASATPSAAAATPSPASATTTATPTPTGTSGRTPAPSEPTATPADPATATPAQPPAQPPAETPPAQPPAETPPAQPPAATPATPSPTPSQQVDADTVKRHLTAARDTLSQLTQLPAAAQLTGDARTQVSQLISNFNELITTNVDWRSTYTKLQGNLTALVGDQRADESPTPAAGTAGAVGTSGAVAVDPAIRAKLVEFRSHLMEFEKAAGGSGSPAAKDPAAEPAEPSAAASAAASPTAAPSSAAASAATPSSASSSTPSSPAPAGTTGSTAQTPATAGTSGTGTPMPAAAEQTAKPSTSSREATTSQAAEGHREAMTHIEAIEAILNGASPAGTSGAAPAAKPGTLERAQVEEIRKHLADLRKELNKSR